MDTVTKLLVERQAAMGMKDGEFADFLGVSRATWCKDKKGLRRPGPKVRMAAARRFPRQSHIFLATGHDTLG